MAGDVAVLTIVSGRNGAFNNGDKAVRIGNGLLESALGGLARSGHDGFMVVEGDGVEDKVVDKGRSGAQQSFRAARAFSFMQIYDRGTFSGQSGGNVCGKSRSEAHSDGHGGAEFHEVTAGNATGLKLFFSAFPAESHGNTHR